MGLNSAAPRERSQRISAIEPGRDDNKEMKKMTIAVDGTRARWYDESRSRD